MNIKYRSTRMSNIKTSQDYWVNGRGNSAYEQLTFTGPKGLEFTLLQH